MRGGNDSHEGSLLMKTSILGDFHASKENVSPNFLQEFETKPPVQQVSPVSAEKKSITYGS